MRLFIRGVNPKFCALLLPLVFGLTACNSLGGLSQNELEATYGAIQPHWIGPARQIDSMLDLGFIDDPKTTGGKIIPRGNSWLPDPVWFKSAGLDHVDLFIKPTTPQDSDWAFGPKLGDPAGVYAFEKHPPNDAACNQYKLSMNRAILVLPNSWRELGAKDLCLTYKFLGPLYIPSGQYIHITWYDRSYDSRGYSVRVEEIRKGSEEVVARAIHCRGFSEFDRAPSFCRGDDELINIFKNRIE